jgi:predicted patatin/cPLA2 family phospholipase
MIDASLILEGGGMRGAYTTGVLDFFLDENIEFSSCYTVSAGACHCCSYLSKQRNRAFRVNVDYLKDKNYAGLFSWITTGNYFGVKMIYEDIPGKLYPYDYEEFKKYKGNFYVVATEIENGEPEYFLIKDIKKDIIKVRASASLPFFAKVVNIDGKEYLDGGITDAIPLRKSQNDGHKKNVVILTRDISYRKLPQDFMGFIRFKFRKYPKLIEKIDNRYLRYNEQLQYIEDEEKMGKIFVIRPGKPVTIGRLEKDRTKLESLYKEGYNDALKLKSDLYSYLNS